MLSSLLQAFGILLFSCAWLAFDHYRPWVNFHSEAMALFGVGLLAASQLLNKNRPFKTPHWIWIVVAVAVVPWLQWLTGVSLFSGDAVVVSLYLYGFAVAIALGYTYVREAPDRLTPVFSSLCIVAMVSAAIGLLQWFSLEGPLGMYVVQTDAGDRAMGNLGQPNQLATLLLMGLASLTWFYERRRIGPTGMIFGTAFLTLVLVLTQSRSGTLSAVAAAFLLVWKAPASSARLRRRHVIAWTLAYLLARQLLPLVQSLLLMSDWRSTLSLVNDNGRFIIWKQMLAGIWESPWVGYGWNQTPTAHASGSLHFPGSMTYTNGHNVVLDILAWNGIPLGVAISLACAYWLLSRIREIKDASALYAMGCLLPIVVHSFFEYPFAYSYFLLAAGLMAGIVEANRPHSLATNVSKRLFAVALSAWFSVGLYAVYEYIQIEEDFQVVRFENLKIGKTPEEYQRPKNIWLLSHMGAMLRAARQEATRDMRIEEIENLHKTSSRFAYGALAFRYALALGLNGQPEAASRQMRIIRGMYGDIYYQAAKSVLRSLEAEKYPELALVLTP